MVRVLLVDDHPVARAALAKVVEDASGIEVAGELADGGDVGDILRTQSPDVAVVSVSRPPGAEAQVCVDIKRHSPATRVILLTATPDERAMAVARGCGAAAVLSKSADLEAIVATIMRVAAGEHLLDPPIEGAPQVGLSPRETDVLRLIARGHSNREIARDLDIADGTAKRHVENILRKLGAGDRAGAVAEGFRRGLVR